MPPQLRRGLGSAPRRLTTELRRNGRRTTQTLSRTRPERKNNGTVDRLTTAGVVAEVEMAVVIRQRRHVALDSVDGLGEQIEVLARPDRNLDVGHGSRLAAPQAGAERDGVATHLAPVRLDAGDTAAAGQNARDAGVLVDPRSPRSGALPFTKAAQRSDGLTRPSSGDQTAPMTSSAFIGGQRSFASSTEMDRARTPNRCASASWRLIWTSRSVYASTRNAGPRRRAPAARPRAGENAAPTRLDPCREGRDEAGVLRPARGQPCATRTESIGWRSRRSPAFMICPGSSWPTATSTSHEIPASLRKSMPVPTPISSSR